MTETEGVPHPLENAETDEVTAEEVSLVLGVARATVHRWRHTHGLQPIRKRGRLILYSRAQILRILADLESK